MSAENRVNFSPDEEGPAGILGSIPDGGVPYDFSGDARKRMSETERFIKAAKTVGIKPKKALKALYWLADKHAKRIGMH